MILLFTTTIRPLYKRDMLNVCCFPEGAFLRFGYAKKQIQDNLQVNQGKAFMDKDALIVLCEFCPGANHATNKADFKIQFHPIRFVTIVQVEEDALGAMVFTLKLKDFYNYDSQPKQRLAAFYANICASDERPHVDGTEEAAAKTTGQSAHYVVESPVGMPAYQNGTWESLVAHVGGLGDLDNCVYFRFKPEKATSSAKDRFLLNKMNWDMETCRPDHVIDAGKSSLVVLQVLFGRVAQQSAPELIVREDIATVCGPFSRQSSQGWETEFLVAFNGSFQEECSTLNFRVPPPNPNDKPISPEWNGLIRILGSHRMLVIAIGVLLFGTGLQAFTPEIASLLPIDPAKKEVFSAIVKGLGTGILGIGAYLGLSKLPVKGGGDD